VTIGSKPAQEMFVAGENIFTGPMLTKGGGIFSLFFSSFERAEDASVSLSSSAA
jgi:hypothetical protein